MFYSRLNNWTSLQFIFIQISSFSYTIVQIPSIYLNCFIKGRHALGGENTFRFKFPNVISWKLNCKVGDMNALCGAAAVGEMKERKEAHPGLKWPPSTDYWGDLWPIVVAHSQNPWMNQDEINLKATLLEGFRVILACWAPFSWSSETFFLCDCETPARI